MWPRALCPGLLPGEQLPWEQLPHDNDDAKAIPKDVGLGHSAPNHIPSSVCETTEANAVDPHDRSSVAQAVTTAQGILVAGAQTVSATTSEDYSHIDFGAVSFTPREDFQAIHSGVPLPVVIVAVADCAVPPPNAAA